MDSAFIAAFEILSFGAIIVLVTLGLGIIASMMGIFNFAQGEFVLLGAYVTYLAATAGLPVWVGMLAAPFIVGLFGFVLERLIIDDAILERDIAEIDLRSPTHYFFVLKSGEKKQEVRGKET